MVNLFRSLIPLCFVVLLNATGHTAFANDTGKKKLLADTPPAETEPDTFEPASGPLEAEHPKVIFSATGSIPEHSPVPQKLLLGYLADNSTFTLIDARPALAYGKAHVEGAINVPPDASNLHWDALPEEKSSPLVVYCRSGIMATKLSQVLAERGYANVTVLPANQIVFDDELVVFNCAV